MITDVPCLFVHLNPGMRPLHYAAWQGKVQPVNLLVKFGSAPNEGSQDGETPLHLASQYGSHMVVRMYLCTEYTCERIS